jgi:hypothetical protein
MRRADRVIDSFCTRALLHMLTAVLGTQHHSLRNHRPGPLLGVEREHPGRAGPDDDSFARDPHLLSPMRTGCSAAASRTAKAATLGVICSTFDAGVG